MKKIITTALGTYLNLMSIVAPATAARHGFLLFCRPFRTSLNEKQKNFLGKARYKMLEIDEHNIQVYKWGTGKRKVLFLHGWQSHTYRWKTYIEAFSENDFTVYALDAPGHGMSNGNFMTVPLYSAVIENFLRETGEFDAIVSHSIGSFSLLYTLHQLPLLQVKRIVLMAPPGEASDFIDFFQKSLGLSDRTMRLVTNYFQQKYGVSLDYFSTGKFAASVHTSALIIHDEDDPETPYHYAKRIESVMPHAKLIATQGLGHNLKSTNVVKYVVDFVNEIEAPEQVHLS